MAITGFLRQMALLHHTQLYILHNERMHRICSITVMQEYMIWYECWKKDDVYTQSPDETMPTVHLWQREGWELVDILGGGGGQHAGMNCNMTVDVALVTLIPTTCLWRNVAQWKSYKSPPAPLKSETAMSYGAEAPSPQRESSYKWKRLADREHRASGAAPTRTAPRFKWQFRVGPWLCWST